MTKGNHVEKLKDRTVIVTGAASGIGEATVRRLLHDGARVVAADLRAEDVEHAHADTDAGDRLLAFAIDVAEPALAASLVEAAEERFGPLHGLVNCAGVRGVGNILDVTPEELDRVLSINLAGTLFTCQAFARSVTEGEPRGAAIVNVSSAAGIRAVPNRLAYVASKFGVVGISQAMALELGPYGIRVNVVCPGMIRTPMTTPMFADPENVERIRAAHPIGREGDPEEIAATNAFLVSDDASFITGSVLAVDGGNTAGTPSFGGREQVASPPTVQELEN
jgi:meso-butanediol dehydrogenase/(S,S)-butanediol dehydrogenase/diacetyl reductase